ncbi:MAG: hypothetical protein IKZ91_01485 [Bacteroidales bacterium]|nr:hypothetical protein [Bacteroidales bacterium]
MRRLVPLLALMLLASCSQPPSREYFQRSDGSGEYEFALELTDSLASYDFSFYTAMDRPVFVRDTLSCFPMQVLWRSPSGRYFSETVYYPVSHKIVLYRKGVVPSEYGTWTVSVTLPEEPKRLRGLGLIGKRVG